MNKTCPRCQTVFVCKVEDISNCQCSSLSIDDKVADLLQATYTDCLCISCLHFVRNDQLKDKPNNSPKI